MKYTCNLSEEYKIEAYAELYMNEFTPRHLCMSTILRYSGKVV